MVFPPFLNAAFGVASFSFTFDYLMNPRSTACYTGCSFDNGVRKVNAAFGVASFSFTLIISSFRLIVVNFLFFSYSNNESLIYY